MEAMRWRQCFIKIGGEGIALGTEDSGGLSRDSVEKMATDT